MKPFYFQDEILGHFVLLVFKSKHEDDDWVVLIKGYERSFKFMRICANDALQAVREAFIRFCDVEKEYKKLSKDG